MTVRYTKHFGTTVLVSFAVLAIAGCSNVGFDSAGKKNGANSANLNPNGDGKGTDPNDPNASDPNGENPDGNDPSGDAAGGGEGGATGDDSPGDDDSGDPTMDSTGKKIKDTDDPAVTTDGKDPEDPASGTCVQSNSKDIITFEKNGAKNQVISTQYLKSHGVSFKLDNGQYPVLAQVNTSTQAIADNPRAWRCGGCTGVTAINSTVDATTKELIGSYVLTQPDVTHDKTPPSLVVTYKSPTSAASGFLVDIDGGEKWVITPLDKKGEPIPGAEWSYTGGAGGKSEGNGIARKWSVSRSKREIYGLKVHGEKKINYFGFAFDQFSPSKRICK